MDSKNSNPTLYVIGTMDTKGPEIQYVAEIIRKSGLNVQTVDVSTTDATQFAITARPADISAEQLLAKASLKNICSASLKELASLDRAQAIEVMSLALVSFLKDEYVEGSLQGAVGLGGSGGTALIAPALRALPIGLPKLLVSTVASGNIAPYVGSSDVMVLPSVVDVSGLNAVSTRILSNAANAMVGMANGPSPDHPTRPAIALSMFGVTTPCVTGVRQALEQAGYDCLVFHATGIGGQAMESLVSSGLVKGIIDLTTTEVADEVVGGVFPAGPKRFDVLSERRLPCVMSVGAMDMVNFGAMHTVPAPFQNRNLHIHNSNVTLMRTTAEENRKCAQWMATKLAKSISPVHLLLPTQGLSALDAPNKPFYDPSANHTLFDELENALNGLSHIRVERVDAHINDPKFIERAIEVFLELQQRSKES